MVFEVRSHWNDVADAIHKRNSGSQLAGYDSLLDRYTRSKFLKIFKKIDVSNKIVMEVGSGSGLNLKVLDEAKPLSIIAVDISDDKLSFAKRLGAHEVLNSQSDGFISKLMKLTNGGADYCVEAGGTVGTIEMGFSLIRKDGGQLIFASHPRHGEMIKLNPHELISGKKIYGSWGGGINPDTDIPKIYSTLKKCSPSFEMLLERRYKLEEINDALDDLELGKVFRPLIVMEH